MANCVQCGKPVESQRECYAIPTCYACLPPPPPLPVLTVDDLRAGVGMSMMREAPDVTCPKCGHEFQEDCYFEMDTGSDLQCPKCETELAVFEVETRMFWSIGTLAEYEEREKKEAERRERWRKVAVDILSRKREG